MKHSFNIERDAEPKNPFGAKLYWKFVVNAGVRFGEILDADNSGHETLLFNGDISHQSKGRDVYKGSVLINDKLFGNTEYVVAKDGTLITFYPMVKHRERYRNKLDGLVDYLLFSGKSMSKERMASFYHQCYLDNNLITAVELIERDLADVAGAMFKDVREETRAEVMKEFENINTEDTIEAVTDYKALVAILENEIKELKKEQEDVLRSGKDFLVTDPDMLIDVDTVTHHGSECTRLTLGDGTHKYMKLSTWDKNDNVTSKAKNLIGKHVRTTCWNPIGSTKWSDMGYFKNIYEVESVLAS
jgi:hypothetical protein